MKSILVTLQTVAFLAYTINGQQHIRAPNAAALQNPIASQIALESANSQNQDAIVSETAFPAAVQQGSKYFQYIHVPAKDHYDHGHKRGNEHHFIERHEKGHPHAGEFKTKVRWGDKHGGYGEHYWDFNHAGHGDGGGGDGGEESQHQEQYAPYDAHQTAEETAQPPASVLTKPWAPAPILSTYPTYTPLAAVNQRVARGNNHNNNNQQHREEAHSIKSRVVRRSAKDDVEYISEGSRAAIQASGRSGRHGGNYRRQVDDSSDEASSQREEELERKEFRNKRGERDGDSYDQERDYDYS